MNNSHNRCNARGVVMVEFAIILPLLVLLLFGITEIGRALYQQNTLHRALTVGARYISHKEGIVTLNLNNTCTAKVDNANPKFDFAANAVTAQNLIVCGVENCTTDQNAVQVLPNLLVGDVDVKLLPNAKEYDATNGLYACIIQVTAHTKFSAIFENLVPFTTLSPPELNAQTEVRYIGY